MHITNGHKNVKNRRTMLNYIVIVHFSREDKSITRQEKTREDKRCLSQDKSNLRVLSC